MTEEETKAGEAAETTAQGTAPADNPADPAPKDAPQDGGDRPFLGGSGKPEGEAGKDGEAGKPEGEAGKDGEAEAPDEQAYLDAVKKDEGVLGNDPNLVFDDRLVKAVIPACREHGVSPKAANAIANAFAKAQIDAAREAYRARCEWFQKLNGEARAKYTDGDFAQINKGIDRCFRPGGVMNNVVRNSELGADPEFLALMHRIGAEAREDDGKGTAAGGGAGAYDPNAAERGLSDIW